MANSEVDILKAIGDLRKRLKEAPECDKLTIFKDLISLYACLNVNKVVKDLIEKVG